MKTVNRCVRCVVTLIWCASVPVLADERAGLNIRTDIDSAFVVVDGAMMGKTPIMLDSLLSGPHEIRVLHPDLESWHSPVIVDSVSLIAGEVRELQYRFARNYLVRSDPSGAEVLAGARILGTTPLVMTAMEEDSVMQVRMQGFESVALDPGRAERGVVQVKLDPIANDQSEAWPLAVEPGGPSVLPLILSGASSLVAGGFSVYFKVQADQVHREYLLTGDPAKLAETRKLDNVAGIALGASQIYLALFSYLLLSQ